MQCLEFGDGVALLYQVYTNIKFAFECLEMGSEIERATNVVIKQMGC